MFLKAIHAIQTTQKGKVVEIEPGSVAEFSQEDADHLIKLGAAVEATPSDETAAALDNAEDDTGLEATLKKVAKMNKANLLKFAAENEVEVTEDNNVAELREKIEVALTEKAEKAKAEEGLL